MKHRWTAALLALVLLAALLPGAARAASGGSGAAGSRLTGLDRTIYEQLKAGVCQIAAGAQTGTAIEIPDLPGLCWSVEELGAGSGQDAVMARLKEKRNELIHMKRIYTALTLDCPYEMFWRGTQYSYSCEYFIQGGRAGIRNLVFTFTPAQAYRGGSEYSVDPAKTAAAARAAENARAIVARYADRSDYGKLTAYREEICRLTAFEQAVLSGDQPYGDPWQLVYVFDGDPGTNVVCEGYAKAFQYLCELSSFRGDVACRLVTGTLNGGDHMWNVVRMGNGNNYLVDVTNCDSGTVGAPDRLFLAGGASENGGRTCVIPVGRSSMTYTYHEDQRDVYTDGYLSLSQSDYAEGSGAASESPPAVQFSDVKPGRYYARPAAWAVREGITDGVGGGRFAPGRTCSHGEIVTMLWRAAGSPAARAGAPVSVNRYFQDAVNWAYEQGIIDASFEAGADCTRVWAAVYLWRAAGSPPASQASAFTDMPAGPAFTQAVNWAVDRRVTDGTGDGATFSPEQACTRGEIVTFLFRAYSPAEAWAEDPQ